MTENRDPLFDRFIVKVQDRIAERCNDLCSLEEVDPTVSERSHAHVKGRLHELVWIRDFVYEVFGQKNPWE